ncbi:RNA processing factor 1 [Verticillium dahliae VdLs.17]|uniref:RNA processing factor 1 n=1 Tax=Verticillium dahliae (strain VdLs.17 / ATCC MYA-4575 / FGSC 10137) TaxID=498257 RepID=G2X6S2_VERDV|nr:RNA processing factor 1 [Verticillium dahliae VdLs.17]EGY14690.1 RNA processing factor 1 [Verticillium dahliae VdLs.17]
MRSMLESPAKISLAQPTIFFKGLKKDFAACTNHVQTATAPSTDGRQSDTMGSQKAGNRSSGASLSMKTSNKMRRKQMFIEDKKVKDKQRHEERHRRRKEEAKNPELREARLAKNKPQTLETKRVWDDVDDDSLGAIVDVEKLKRRRLEEEERAANEAMEVDEEEDDEEDDNDSMLDSGDEDDEERQAKLEEKKEKKKRAKRDDSMAPSTTSTNLDLTPSSLSTKVPDPLHRHPTAASQRSSSRHPLNSTLHHEADVFCTLFPPTPTTSAAPQHPLRPQVLSPRDQPLRRPIAKNCPGHGKPPPTHLPGTAAQQLQDPPRHADGQALPDTRDYLFWRRHRYVFRDKRATEKNITTAEGKDLEGVEGIRVGLQEVGPRFTLKLRRVDKGVGRAGSEGEDALQWEWKGKMEKDRKRFNL